MVFVALVLQGCGSAKVDASASLEEKSEEKGKNEGIAIGKQEGQEAEDLKNAITNFKEALQRGQELETELQTKKEVYENLLKGEGKRAEASTEDKALFDEANGLLSMKNQEAAENEPVTASSAGATSEAPAVAASSSPSSSADISDQAKSQALLQRHKEARREVEQQVAAYQQMLHKKHQQPTAEEQRLLDEAHRLMEGRVDMLTSDEAASRGGKEVASTAADGVRQLPPNDAPAASYAELELESLGASDPLPAASVPATFGARGRATVARAMAEAAEKENGARSDLEADEGKQNWLALADHLVAAKDLRKHRAASKSPERSRSRSQRGSARSRDVGEWDDQGSSDAPRKKHSAGATGRYASRGYARGAARAGAHRRPFRRSELHSQHRSSRRAASRAGTTATASRVAKRSGVHGEGGRRFAQSNEQEDLNLDLKRSREGGARSGPRQRAAEYAW